MNQDFINNVLFSGVMGASAKFATYPLGRVKMVSQANGLSSFETLKRWKTIEHSKPSALWQGCGLSVLRSSIQTGVQVTVFDHLVHHHHHSKSDKINKKTSAMYNIIAGNGATILAFPIDNWYKRLAIKMKEKPLDFWQRQQATKDEFYNMIKNRSAYQGIGTKMISAAPFNALFGASFVALQPVMNDSRFLAAFSAAAISSIVCHPLDTLALQSQTSKEKGVSLYQYLKGYKSIGPIKWKWTDTKMSKMWSLIHSHYFKSGSSMWHPLKMAYAGLLPAIIKCGVSYSFRWGPKHSTSKDKAIRDKKKKEIKD